MGRLKQQATELTSCEGAGLFLPLFPLRDAYRTTGNPLHSFRMMPCTHQKRSTAELFSSPRTTLSCGWAYIFAGATISCTFPPSFVSASHAHFLNGLSSFPFSRPPNRCRAPDFGGNGMAGLPRHASCIGEQSSAGMVCSVYSLAYLHSITIS